MPPVFCLSGSRRRLCRIYGRFSAGAGRHRHTPKTANDLLPQPSIASSIPALAEFKKGHYDLGYNLQLDYFADGLSNPTGGVRQGAVYEGILYMVLDADLAKIAGMDGLSFRVNAYQIHGGQLSASNILSLATVDSIEARPGTRLFELWVEQNINNMMSIRIGQLAADNQFFISDFANSLYINSTFGWPTRGGPAKWRTCLSARYAGCSPNLIRTITSLFSPACTTAIPLEPSSRTGRD
ncbi:MAG: hypothetical protein USCAAHI_02081 [Beijerinckiaceae bacterium]|nr:MAG: hypothetical protein USCAAHI_02081 [Beijerinckiaceae bacterium]